MGGTTYRTGLETQTAYDSLWAQPTTHKVTHGDFLVNARWRKEQPALTVSTRTTDFTDVLRQGGVTALPKGTRTLPLVFAGDGAAAEYARLDARGKAVVVRRDDDVADGVQAANAVAAGATLLLVVNNEDGRALRGYGEPFGPPVALDVALLSTDEGEKLAAQAKVRGARVTVTSRPVSPDVYDLLASWHNEIPTRMTSRADPAPWPGSTWPSTARCPAGPAGSSATTGSLAAAGPSEARSPSPSAAPVPTGSPPVTTAGTRRRTREA
ncbi:PA domain-containing protein [Streptomyces violaceoruber]